MKKTKIRGERAKDRCKNLLLSITKINLHKGRKNKFEIFKRHIQQFCKYNII